MKNNKGQALIEFVLILPVLIIILMYAIDATKIAIEKNKIENDMNTIIDLYNKEKTQELNNYISNNNIEYKKNTKENLTTITIKRKIKFTMPLLKKIINEVETTRTIYEADE